MLIERLEEGLMLRAELGHNLRDGAGATEYDDDDDKDVEGRQGGAIQEGSKRGLRKEEAYHQLQSRCNSVVGEDVRHPSKLGVERAFLA